MVDVLWVDQPLDGLKGGDAGTEEDRGDDEVAGTLFRSYGAQHERDGQRDRRERVAEVVDQICQQRDAAGGSEHDGLRRRGDEQDDEADCDGAYSGTRAGDREIDEAVTVAVAVAVAVAVVMS